ncbi:MAG: primosomal protein N' [Lachnospira sp.]|nr:primosomal protein N' [Lachnospira sp.]
MFVNVIVDISYEKLDRAFQYAVPANLEHLIEVGMRVNVPFGRGNKLIEAYVIEITDICNYEPEKIKSIVSISEKMVPIEMNKIKLAAWIRKYYGATMNQALKTVIPVKNTVRANTKKIIKLLMDTESLKEELERAKKKNAKARVRLIEALMEESELDYSLVADKLNITPQVIKALADMQVIEIIEEKIYRNPIKVSDDYKKNITLNEEQRKVAESIYSDYQSGVRKTYLLHGVTGSGKTEVYIDIIEKVLLEGKQVIMLIPEISLTYQTVMRFYKRFGDKVSVMHSKLSEGEKYDQMMRAKSGDISIIIGPRSALFTPFEKLGLIIIDEEHDGAYKSEKPPKYHARETAIELARMNNASVILGSATPSVTSYYKAKNGEFQLFELNSRAQGAMLPKVYVEDMRQELAKGNRTIFSQKLDELINKRIENNEQIMLFINRRGYSGCVSCRECGEAIKCKHCDVTLKFHKNNKLMCHYCGYEEDMVKKCPSCGSKYIATFGTGTEKIEEQIKQRYPSLRTLRMDADTVVKKGAYEHILSEFRNQEADVLIGTQMIVKGHDFPNVTLVGIMAADISLYANDYTAGENTFALLMQAGGRAGRADKLGEVVIQTYAPKEETIVAASEHDYQAFYEDEISYREMLGYPPIMHMMEIKVSSKYENALEKAIKLVAKELKSDEDLTVLGPVNAPIYKLNDIFNKLVYLKAKDKELLVRYKERVERLMFDNEAFKYINIQFDFN